MSAERPSHLIKTELVISYVLRYGAMLCSAVIAVGLAARLTDFGSAHGSSHELIATLVRGGVVPAEAPPSRLADLAAGVLAFHPDAVMAAGLLLLIALPIARVGMTVALFLLEGDWAFLVITLIVFSVLLFGIFFGRAL